MRASTGEGELLMMWWDGGGWGAGRWLWMSLLMVVFWGSLVALGLLLARSVSADQRRASAPATSHAEKVLAERFARGEIDADEFARRRELLHSSDTIS
jgi:putative membrane protein